VEVEEEGGSAPAALGEDTGAALRDLVETEKKRRGMVYVVQVAIVELRSAHAAD